MSLPGNRFSCMTAHPHTCVRQAAHAARCASSLDGVQARFRASSYAAPDTARFNKLEADHKQVDLASLHAQGHSEPTVVIVRRCVCPTSFPILLDRPAACLVPLADRACGSGQRGGARASALSVRQHGGKHDPTHRTAGVSRARVHATPADTQVDVAVRARRMDPASELVAHDSLQPTWIIGIRVTPAPTAHRIGLLGTSPRAAPTARRCDDHCSRNCVTRWETSAIMLDARLSVRAIHIGCE